MTSVVKIEVSIADLPIAELNFDTRRKNDRKVQIKTVGNLNLVSHADGYTQKVNSKSTSNNSRQSRDGPHNSKVCFKFTASGSQGLNGAEKRATIELNGR